jgi:hypothetical protein
MNNKQLLGGKKKERERARKRRGEIKRMRESVVTLNMTTAAAVSRYPRD